MKTFLLRPHIRKFSHSDLDHLIAKHKLIAYFIWHCRSCYNQISILCYICLVNIKGTYWLSTGKRNVPDFLRDQLQLCVVPLSLSFFTLETGDQFSSGTKDVKIFTSLSLILKTYLLDLSSWIFWPSTSEISLGVEATMDNWKQWIWMKWNNLLLIDRPVVRQGRKMKEKHN